MVYGSGQCCCLCFGIGTIGIRNRNRTPGTRNFLKVLFGGEQSGAPAGAAWLWQRMLLDRSILADAAVRRRVCGNRACATARGTTSFVPHQLSSRRGEAPSALNAITCIRVSLAHPYRPPRCGCEQTRLLASAGTCVEMLALAVLPLLTIASSKDKAFYDANGYVHIRGVFNVSEAQLLAQWVEEVGGFPPSDDFKWLHHYERTDSGPRLARTENFVSYHPQLGRYLMAGALPELVGSVLGEEVFLYKEKINYKYPGGAGYAAHQDAPAYKQIDSHLTALVAIEPATMENGCLEFAAGRHQEGLIGLTDEVRTLRSRFLSLLPSSPPPLSSSSARASSPPSRRRVSTSPHARCSLATSPSSRRMCPTARFPTSRTSAARSFTSPVGASAFEPAPLAGPNGPPFKML